MTDLTRRGVLAASAAVTAAAAAPASSAAAASAHQQAAPAAMAFPREKLLLDFGWRFHLGHAADPSRDFSYGTGQRTYAKSGTGFATCCEANFNDADWQVVDLPHDWAVALPFAPVADTPAFKALSSHGYKPLGRDYPDTSIGWYRRRFDLAASDQGRRIVLAFDGVFRDCAVVFNGHVVAHNKSGYAPFTVDVTDFATYGGANVLVVRADATLGEGWFYEGAGIYRHVWLIKSTPLHLVEDGLVVRARPQGQGAVLDVAAEIANSGDAAEPCALRFTVRDPAGKIVAHAMTKPMHVAPGETVAQTSRITLDHASLWSLETPHLYQLGCEVIADGAAIDGLGANFGIRTIRFDGKAGFFLNGKPVKLKGTCNHQDHAGIGSALPDRVHAFRIEKLKEMGSNAYRASHNPPAPELLDACDRLGMLVVDETRMASSDPEGLSQMARLVRRDRNHPSVILWSISNEEHAQQGNATGARIARSMKKLCNRLDSTRLITAAMDNSWGQGISSVIDVIGFNYRTDKIDAYHAQVPAQPVIGTETGSTTCTRGVYAHDDANHWVPAYDTECPSYASTASAWWNIAVTRPFIGGGFVWTGFDYRGEPTPFRTWPSVSSNYGILDTCGFPKDNFYYYKAWWDAAPLLHVFPHWSWQGQAGKPVKLWAHSNLERVELFLNGASLGSRIVEPCNHVEWDVPFAPGVLEARGYRGGQLVLTARRETAGAAAGVRLSADRTTLNADGEDVAMLTAEIVDAQGRVVPQADNEVTFRVTGPGAVIGVGNGNPASAEADKADHRKAFNGMCAAILQVKKTAGAIQVEASSPGLAAGTLTLTAVPAVPRPSA